MSVERRWLILYGLFSLVFAAWSMAAAAAEPAAQAPAKPEITWREVTVKGAPGDAAAYVGTISDEVEFEGRKVRHTLDFYMTAVPTRGGPDVYKQTRNIDTWYEPDGRLIQIKETKETPGGSLTTSIRTSVQAGKDWIAIIRSSAAGDGAPEISRVPEGTTVYAAADEWLLKQRGFKKGEKVEHTVFSLGTMKLEKETITAVDVKKVKYGGKEIEAMVYERTDSHDLLPADLISSPMLKMLRTQQGDKPVTEQMFVSPDFKILHTAGGVLEASRVQNVLGTSPWGR